MGLEGWAFESNDSVQTLGWGRRLETEFSHVTNDSINHA